MSGNRKYNPSPKHLSGDGGGGSQVHAALPSRNRAEWRKEEKE